MAPQETLEGLTRAITPLPWELLVVDNGSSSETAGVLTRFEGILPIKALTEPKPGKSRAINRALEVAEGSLILFTDDDVTVSVGWMTQLHRASQKYPMAKVFCGPIVPRFPENTPDWIRDHPFAAPAFARFWASCLGPPTLFVVLLAIANRECRYSPARYCLRDMRSLNQSS